MRIPGTTNCQACHGQSRSSVPGWSLDYLLSCLQIFFAVALEFKRRGSARVADMTGASNTAGNQDVVWDYYQNEVPEYFAASYARLRFLANRIQNASSVLNIGCGTAIFEQLALARRM